MKLEEQVCSFELASKLKELGIKKESFFYWQKKIVGSYDGCGNPGCLVEHNPNQYGKNYEVTSRPDRYQHPYHTFPAFTVGELGEMLPGNFGMDWFLQFWKSDFSGPASFSINYKDPKTEGKPEIGWMRETIIEKTEADARAKMLIYLIEKEIVNP